MTGQGNRDVDVESLLQGRRGGCLDAFLVASIIFLFAAVAAVAAGGAMIEKELRAQLKSPSPTLAFQRSTPTGDNSNQTYKMRTSVYLEAGSSQLQTSTMQWAEVQYGSGSSVGSNFHFNKDQNSLKFKQEGIYFIYVEFNFTCTYDCNAGRLIVQLGHMLTCEVELPAATYTPVIKKCLAVGHMSHDETVVTQMIVPKEQLPNWKLELTGSRLWLFLVD